MEDKFGKPHPELEGYIPPRNEFLWLVDSFFRLHRRRGLSEIGIQPLSITDIHSFGVGVLQLHKNLLKTFIRCMEDIDNAVLSDYYTKKG